MTGNPETGEWAFRIDLADGRAVAAVLTVTADAWLLRARPVAADGRALGPGEVVVGWNDEPGLAALLLLAGADAGTAR